MKMKKKEKQAETEIEIKKKKKKEKDTKKIEKTKKKKEEKRHTWFSATSCMRLKKARWSMPHASFIFRRLYNVLIDVSFK